MLDIVLDKRFAVGTRIDGTSYADATERVILWTKASESRSVYAANVHMVMEGHDDPGFQQVINRGDLVTPDGMPLVWALRLQGVKAASRVYGPDLMRAVLRAAELEGIKVGLYGGSHDVLDRLLSRVHSTFPDLRVVYSEAPPFRPLSPAEDEEVVRAVRTSGARILFVGLGCPKQERWIASHRGRINAVMLGVGAAFEFLAKTKPQAPGWMQASGLEWAFRFATEPRRLWKRYAKHNPRFVILMLLQVLRGRTRAVPTAELG